MNNNNIKNIISSANNGDIKSQLVLGDMYRDGFIIKQNNKQAIISEQDYKQAEYWYLKVTENSKFIYYDYRHVLCEHDYGYAFYELGKIYLNKESVLHDNKKALDCFKKAVGKYIFFSNNEIRELCFMFPRNNDSINNGNNLLKYTLIELILRIKEEINN